MPSLQRPRHGTVIAGVCAAIAYRFGWSVAIVRLVFVLSILLPGPQVLIYVLLWIFIPKEPVVLRAEAPAEHARDAATR